MVSRRAVLGGCVLLAALAVGAFSYGVSIMLCISGAQQLGASRSQLLFSTSPFLDLGRVQEFGDAPTPARTASWGGLKSLYH